jgi:hypothetical protein
VVSSTAAAALRQLVMFVVDKVVEEHCSMLLANELQSIILPDWTTQALGSATCDTFAIFEDLCWVTENVRDSYNSNTFTRRLISS